MSRDKPRDLPIQGAGNRFGIIAARYNNDLVEALIASTRTALTDGGVADEDIEVLRVPGSNEIPYAVNLMAETAQFDCLIGLGVVIAGDTDHHRIIADGTAQSLQAIGVDTFIPIINGIVVVNSEAQAIERCTGKLNRGREFGRAALEMALLKVRFSERLEDYDTVEAGSELGYEDDPSWDGGFREEDGDRDTWKS